MRKPPNPTRVRAALEARSRGESLRDVARKFGVAEGTIRNWERKAGGPPVGAAAPPPPASTSLTEDLAALAAELDGADEPRWAGVCRAAIDALRMTVPDEPDDVPPPPDGAGALETVRHLVNVNRAAYQRCVSTGLESAAQRYSRTIAQLAPVLARLEREGSEGTDVVSIPRAEVAPRTARVRQDLARLVSQPLTCAKCGAALRLAAALTAAGVDL